MSVSALTTAMAVAAAAVPNVAPAPVVEFATEPVSIDHDAQVGSAERSEATLPPVAQSTLPLQLKEPGQSMEQAELAEAAQSTDPALTAEPQPQPEPQAPVGEPTDIVVLGRKPVPEDPMVQLNAKSFEVAQSVDESIVAPIAFAYGDIVPRPVRKGLQNFLHNLGEPVVFLNFLLQLKFDKAAETLGRFAINTALGAGGLVDVAKRKPFYLPRRENGFANTLGYYGVKPGPYFYLPLVGPTTLRDFIGGRLDLILLPAFLPKVFGKPEVVVPVWVLKELGRRIDFEDELQDIRATRDPYVAARNYYLQKRQAEIDALHGRKVPTVKPPAAAPTSQNPAPAPISLNPVAIDTGILFGELSTFGTVRYMQLMGDFTVSPIVRLRDSYTF